MSVSHLGMSASQESAPQPDRSDARDGPAGSWVPWRLAVVFELRRSEPFAKLTRAEWAVFEAIATVWDRGAREWPTQWALARCAGYSERAVRLAIVELKRRGILGEEAHPPGAWAQQGRCVPGPVIVRELGAIRRRFAPASVAAPVPPVAAAASPVAGTVPPSAGSVSAVAASLRQGAADHRQPVPLELNTNKDLLLEDAGNGPRPPAAASAEPPTPDPREEVTSSQVTNEDRAVALTAIAECFRRRFPDRPPPRDFYPDDVASVARCAASVGGDADGKLQALRDALAGASRTSRQPPTVRYVWGTLEHFRAHLRSGRQLRGGPGQEKRAPIRPAQPSRTVPPAAQGGQQCPGGTDPTLVASLLDAVFNDASWRNRT